jgi:hypothetical protein
MGPHDTTNNQGGMGFRDPRAFNLTMIAKQGWNILTKPHSLVARIYKARYFPNFSFFDAKIGHNPSYAWRGVWKARQILMHGCRWSLGSGANIRVMSDPWLRGNDGGWILSPQTQGVHNLNVSDLMVLNVKLWDKAKIEPIFPLHVAKRIIEIPLLESIGDDKIVWIDNANGAYSVKSGYKVMLKITWKFPEVTQREEWYNLWKIRAPPKAKHLLRRIIMGCLPTRIRLQKKRVLCLVLCPLCNQHNEDD